MIENKTKQTLPRSERLVVVIAIICLLFFVALWLNDDLFGFLLRLGISHSNKPVIGEIALIENDTRHRDSLELSWEPAYHREEVRVGDGVFTGHGSKAQVVLKRGAKIDMGENTLIIFSALEGQEFPQLDRGDFLLKLQGKLKLSLKGEVVEFNGQDSQVQIFVDHNNKPRMRLLSGKVNVTSNGKEFALQPDKVANTQAPDVQAKPNPILAVAAKAHPLQPLNEYTYIDELDDIYEKKSEIDYIERDQRLPWVKLPTAVAWKNEGLPKVIYGQLANTRDFEKPILFQSIGNVYDFATVFLGNNFWRVSTDGHEWEQSYFKVTNTTTNTSPPSLRIDTHHFEMPMQTLLVTFPIESDIAYKGYLVETSTAPLFIHGQTQIRWVGNGNLHAEFHRTGDFFFRVRGVTPNLQLSRFSEVQKVSVSTLPGPESPRLADGNLHGYTNEPLETRWSASKRARKYLLEIYDEHGKIVHKNTLREPALRFQSKKAGRFNYKVTALDKFGRSSQPSQSGGIVIEDRVAEQPKPQPKPAAERVPAQVESVMSLGDDFSGYQNRTYSSSQIELEGAMSTMYSRDQLAQNVGAPVSLMATLRGLFWKGSNGAEGSVKTKVVDLNAEGNINSPLQVELRYMHRWMLPFNPFFSFHQMQVTSLLGYEAYHNTGGALYSPGYDLVKAGFAPAFPALHHWDTGGEVLYGSDFKGETKYEVAGFMNYYIQTNCTFGVGYRVHLFEADSAQYAPAGVMLPFREGYGEGYSVLSYHY